MHLFDQERLLDESITCVKQCALQMERCLDKGDLVGAIHHCADMLREMRTSALSPKSYYELYIVVTEKLRLLESTLIEEHKNGKKLSNLYETIQYVANIIPRLYLLITVGVYHIKCAELSRREIIRDLVEMCSGVQHPVRGLFLRSYLLHALRTELLPVNEDPEPKQDLLKTEDANTSDVTATSPDPEKKSADMSSAHTDSQGTISDSIRFLLLNFSEMNKLWVRMQHQGHSRDRERREQERRELRLLVGTNLNRLSQLEGIDVIRYQTQVLPPIIEQLIVCRDVIAQEYLMDVIIQVFPDEFHLSTLRTLLATCNQLQPGVRLRQIICSLVERLSQFALNELSSGRSVIVPEAVTTNCTQVPPDQDSVPGEQSVPESESNLDSETALFTLFFDGLCDLIEARIRLSRMGSETQIPSGRHALINLATLHGLPPEDIPAMFSSLVYLAMVLYPKQSPSLVDICLKATADSLEQLGISLVAPASPLSKELLNLLHLPLGGSPFHMSTNTGHSGGNAPSSAAFEAMGELRTVLGMSGFRRLVTLLDPKTTKCRLACNLLAGTLERDQRQRQAKKFLHTKTPISSEMHEVWSDNSCRLTSEADLDGLFDLISGLLSPSSNMFDDPDEFAEVQSLIAGVLHLIGPLPRTEDPGLCYSLFCKAQSTLAQAGPRIIRFNFPALVFEGLQLIRAYSELEDKQGDWDDAVHKVVSFVHRCITCLVAADAPEIALRLFLQASLVIDRVEFSKRESMTYEFVSQALTLYEEGVSEARAQIDSMSLITSTLCQLRCFTDDNRNTLRTQCSRAAAHLLRKHDQSRAVAASAHLFWPLPILMRQNVKPSVMVSLTEKPVKTETVRECLEQLSESDLKVLRDGKAALACLDRAARLAQDCMDATVKAQLFMNILNHAISLRLQNCLEVTDDRINNLIETVKALIDELNPTTAAAEEIVRHLENTISFVHHCQTVPDPSNSPADHVTELFSSVNLS
ncbi:Vacuolar protein sorting-associated protein 35 [Clonorchis sinensis]|uniref:Vacuolar protein sorting-associated protein 35 n=2 Tax=Clonorchis sinensis TaxID=79923 RepID=A0A419QGR3_CLOSI|nr:Vacuolar protein sorting-associated protein 35 [Clonorchis sinensis]